MPWGAAIGAVASIGGALISSSAAGDAASAQENSANQANATQLQMFNQVQQNLAPYMGAGQNALSAYQQFLGLAAPGSASPGANLPNGAPSYTSLSNLIGGNGPNTTAMLNSLKSYPGYQFSLQQGQNALNASNAARGLLTSGAQVKDATAYGQGMASNLYNNYYNQLQNYVQNYGTNLAGLANVGQNSAAGVGNAAIQTGNSIASNTIGAGNAAASGIVGQANAFNQGIAGAGQNALLGYQLANQNNNPNGIGGYDWSGGGLTGYGNTNGNYTYNQFINGQ